MSDQYLLKLTKKALYESHKKCMFSDDATVIVVVSSNGGIVYVENPAGKENANKGAESKAKTACFMGKDTSDLADDESANPVSFNVLLGEMGMAFVPGGSPIVDKCGNVIGGVGVVTVPSVIDNEKAKALYQNQHAAGAKIDQKKASYISKKINQCLCDYLN